jgi:hypothetical protein
MADETIRETVVIDGDSSGGEAALKRTSQGMGDVEKRAAGVASKLQSWGSGVVGFFSRVSSAVSTVSKIAIAGAVVGVALLTRKLLELASVSDQAKEFKSTWDQVKATLAAPFVHFLADAFRILNAAMKDPAVQGLIRDFALLATVILQSLLPAISAIAGAITAFAHAFAEGDFANIFQRTWAGFVAGWKDAGKSAGAGAGASFNQAWEEEAKKAAKAAGASNIGPLRGGFLKDIGDLGTKALNAFLSGFKKPDLDVLNQAADAIKARLDTLFKSGSISEISIVPRIVVAQTAVAQALKEVNDAGGVNDDIIARLSQKLQGLGPDVVEYVTELLRARDATVAVEKATDDVAKAQQRVNDAQSDLATKQSDLKTAQSDLAEAETRHAQAMQDLDDKQFDAETNLLKLQEAQEAELEKLAPLRQAVADAAEAQYQAELKVRQAQDDLIPLQQKLNDAQKAERDLQASISEKQRLRSEAIQDAQNSLNDAIAAQEAALKGVDGKYAGQIAVQQKIIDAVDAKWKKEIDGATETYNLALKRFNLEDARNKRSELSFARQRAQAQLINDPNTRIAALARINRAEQQFNERNKDRLDAAKIEADLANETLKNKEAARDAEKAEAVAEIARIQDLITSEKAVIQERLDSIKEEGQARIEAMQRQNEELSRSEAADVRAAAARVAAAQADVDAQQVIIAAAQREAEIANRRSTDAQRELDSREKAIHDESDGAIDTAKKRLVGLQEDERQLSHNADIEERPLRAKVEAAQGQVDAAQALVDAAQGDLDASNKTLDNSQKSLDNFQKAADTALTRLTTEQDITSEIDQQRQLLDAIAQQQQQMATAGPAGAGFGSNGLDKLIGAPFTQEQIDAFKAKLKDLFDKAKEAWDGFDWKSWGDSLWNGVVSFVKDHAGELLVGLAALLGPAQWASLGLKFGKLLLDGLKLGMGSGGAGGGGGVPAGGIPPEGFLPGFLAPAAWTALGLTLGTAVIVAVGQALKNVGADSDAARNMIAFSDSVLALINGRLDSPEFKKTARGGLG